MVFKVFDIIILSSLRCGCCTQHLCVHRVPGRRGSETGVFGFLARHPPKAPFFVYGLARRHAGVSVRFPRAGLRLMSFMLSLVVCVGHRSGQRVVLSIFCFSCSFHSRNLVNLINFPPSAVGCSVLAPSLVRGQPCPRCSAGCRGQGCPRTISSPTPALRPPLPGRGRLARLALHISRLLPLEVSPSPPGRGGKAPVKPCRRAGWG